MTTQPPLMCASDDAWGIAGALIGPAFPGAEAFSATPVLQLLRDAAARTPDAVAIAGTAARLRYDALMQRVEAAARAIAARVGPGAPVALLLRRTPDAAAAVLGCVASGRLAMVLDPSDPPARLAMLMEDCRPALVVCDDRGDDRGDARGDDGFNAGPDVAHLRLSAAIGGPAECWVPDVGWDPDAPMAVHFTSGSSGRPKGIVLSGRSMLLRGFEGVELGALSAGDCMLAASGFTSSHGLAFLIATLSRNARTALASLVADGANGTLRVMAREGVTHVSMTWPSLRTLLNLELAKAAFARVRCVQTGAMPLPRAELAALRAALPPDCAIIHTYSSTEALDIARWTVLAHDAGADAVLPVGALRPTNEYAIIQEDGSRAAPGEAGELVIRSRTVALGDWQAGRLVTARMPPAPGDPQRRVFRTGDIVRVQADGMLRVLGRLDRQIKINGVRVEPGEIEAVLKAQAGVADAAVIASPDAAGVSTLTGFVAAPGAAPGADAAALIQSLRRRLAEALPPALRPRHLVVLDRLPLLPGGKTDFAALRESAIETRRTGEETLIGPQA